MNLTFLRGAELDDPHGLLVGEGSKMRHIRLEEGTLADRRVTSLVRAAADQAGFAIVPGAKGRLVVKKVYPKQRPRRPG